MTLSKERAQELGFVFANEDEHRGLSEPDQPHFSGDLTIDGHTEHFQGKSEQAVLASVEDVLVARGKIQRTDVTESSDVDFERRGDGSLGGPV